MSALVLLCTNELYWLSVPYRTSSQHAVTFENQPFCICTLICHFVRVKLLNTVFVPFPYRTGDSRGFGFLSLEKDEDADAAIRACDETEWNGRIILVEKSKAPTW
jgi:RNA recognition motif-containing protein